MNGAVFAAVNMKTDDGANEGHSENTEGWFVFELTSW